MKISACDIINLTQLQNTAKRHVSFIFRVLIEVMIANPGLESIEGVSVNTLSNPGW